MPWEVLPVAEIRLAFVHQVLSLHSSVAQACRKFHISRKTGYKWLARYRQQPEQPLLDRSRRPHDSPAQTDADVENRVVEVRQQFGWGPRKIRALLARDGLSVPSVRTVANILTRRGCIATIEPPTPDPIRFERDAPNQLWQCDHKGPIEIARQKIFPFTVLDDHSRFLLALRPCTDLTMKTAFAVLWDTFGEFGLPDSILTDNAFSTFYSVPKTISWFDAQLVRLGIHPTHGRPYHPQTQGKAERLHGTLERELLPRTRRDSIEHFEQDANRWRTDVYNSIRPHEAIGDRPPLARFQPSTRARPEKLPPVEYPSGSVLRKVSLSGDVRWHCYRILAGYGIIGQYVRIEERDHELALFYAWKQIRTIPHSALELDKML